MTETVQVLGHELQQSGMVLHESDQHVAEVAKKGAYLPCLVVMIYMQFLSLLGSSSADGASTSLLLQHEFELFNGQTVLPKIPSSAISSSILTLMLLYLFF